MSSVGEVLRLERERQGRTLKEVSDALHIKREYLSALEEEQYDDIPGAVFVKGFIRNYGNYLDLDGAVLVEEYKAAAANIRTPRPEVRPAPSGRTRPRRRAAKRRRKSGRWPEITIVAGVILFLLLIIWMII